MSGKYRWGILGTAEIALELVRGIKAHPGSELRAIASRDQSKAEAWSKQLDIPLAFGSYDDCLASGELDIVYVPLPNSLHAEWAIKALETGHHVLCEKPIAVNAEEARTIAAAATKAKRCLAEGFMYRHHPQWARVQELIDEGMIGRISSLYSRFTFLLDDPTANPASKALAGGALNDVGSYCVHFSRLIAGCEPLRVSALQQGEQVDETMVGLLEFPNGILAQFETSIDNYERHGAEIAGTTGSIVLASPWIPGDQPAQIVLNREGHAPETIEIPSADSYALEVENFVRVCDGKVEARLPIDDAIANTAVLDALKLSALESRAVKI
jgi:D-xylose 1-dehydrogenase (NADP+, D-xylono-1,5-lactone-forming)